VRATIDHDCDNTRAAHHGHSVGNLYGGIPFDIVDANELLGLLWSFSWSDVAVPYPVDVTIDNLRFF